MLLFIACLTFDVDIQYQILMFVKHAISMLIARLTCNVHIQYQLYNYLLCNIFHIAQL